MRGCRLGLMNLMCVVRLHDQRLFVVRDGKDGVVPGHEAAVEGTVLAGLGLAEGTELTPKQLTTVGVQFGTLGSGNHFVEVCLDERDHVWTVLHSGSRGIGNQLASRHIEKAKG